MGVLYNVAISNVYSKVETSYHLSISMVMLKDRVFQELSVSSEIST